MAHRKEWLRKEGKLELWQYLWIQMPLEKAVSELGTGDKGGHFRALIGMDDSLAADCDEEATTAGGVPEDTLLRSLRKDMVYRYLAAVDGRPVSNDVLGAEPWIELHVDLLPPEVRRKKAAIFNGFNMGGRLSVRFPQREKPIVKVGEDEVIFKMYQTNQSSWEMDGVKAIGKKTDGKGNMKVAFVDEVMGLAGNLIPEAMWVKFQKKRRRRLFDNPSFVE